MKLPPILALVLVLILVLIIAPALAYVLIEDPSTGETPRWPGARAVIHHDPETVTAPYVAALARALETWSQVPRSDFRFAHGGPSVATEVRSTDNGSSDCWFDDRLDRAVYATTVATFDGSGVIRERDILFNANPDYAGLITWTTTPTSRPGGPVDFETVALHELGHAIGLDHPKPSQSNVYSVMNTIYRFRDPAFPNRALFDDDERGVRALYPEGSRGGADLVLEGLSVSPDGGGYRIDLTVRNDGTEPTGRFGASAHLTGSVAPSSLDPLLGTAADAFELNPGETTEVPIEGRVGSAAPPGEYRIGAILDPAGVVPDVDRSNNAAVSSGLVTVTRPPVPLAPGQTVEGGIGPHGTDSFTMALVPGTRLRLRGRMSTGTAALSLFREGAEIAISKVGSKPKLTLTVTDGGAHVLEFLSGFSGVTDYRIRVKAKTLKGKWSETGDEVRRFPVPVYAGSEVKVVVRGKKGFVPTTEIAGMAVPRRTNGKGTKVTFGPFEAPETGEVEVRVDAGAGAGGYAVSYRVKVPTAGGVVVR